jgi:hypothetical protein
MVATMVRQFMPGSCYSPHQSRIAFRNPGQRKKGRLDSGIVKHGEQCVGIGLNAAFARIPAIARDYILERTDLKPVFNIDR